ASSEREGEQKRVTCPLEDFVVLFFLAEGEKNRAAGLWWILVVVEGVVASFDGKLSDLSRFGWCFKCLGALPASAKWRWHSPKHPQDP
ncbi:hypothetical protein AVEN_152745-1, partial [Araneus ventricosus]